MGLVGRNAYSSCGWGLIVVRKKPLTSMSIPEIQALLAQKRREQRWARLQQYKRSGRIVMGGEAEGQGTQEEFMWEERGRDWATEDRTAITGRTDQDRIRRILLVLEIGLVTGFLFILLSGFLTLTRLNRETVNQFAGPAPSPTPLIRAVVLPSGHTPPTSPGGAQFNEEEIPEHLRPAAQSYVSSLEVPPLAPQQARSISIPVLWENPAPVVQGDGWEQLKKGVAQHIGTANPGEVGNVVLSAHNDIYGELFRDLDRLQPGDEIKIFTATSEYLYRVTGTRIVEPTEVSVMDPTPRPTVTLISCYPYLIDTERIIVFGELASS
jgi:sortase A